MKWRVLVVLVLGALGGLASALATRLIFNLPVDPKTLMPIWMPLAGASAAGIIVLFMATQMMAQSNPKFPKRTVVIVIGVAVGVLGVIVCGGFLLVLRFTNQVFYQGQGMIDSVLSALISGGIAMALFLAAVPIRGFEYPREGGSAPPERFAVKIRAKTLERLRGKAE
ncbi:MAG: hypothetical protein HUU25_05540 [Candidatus Sumerlaeia bacterium]|nr:hypothetical protein [Candidatus Sumerlaeia bacterium]